LLNTPFFAIGAIFSLRLAKATVTLLKPPQAQLIGL
jgi:hypothetical protein